MTSAAASASQTTEQPSFSYARWLFLRALGLVYFFNFASLGSQILGLIGKHGISPATHYLYVVGLQADAIRYWLVPTLAWINSSDTALQLLCISGAFASICAFAGVLTAPALIICYVIELSLVSIGQEFLSYQWDYLLLEVGFVAMFLPAWRLFEKPWPWAKPAAPASRIIIWLLRIIIFKLMFMSGLAKISSGDVTWSQFTALNYHYETQPLPTPLGWAAAQLPHWFQSASVLAMFFIELVAPVFIFTTRRLRAVSAALFLLLQTLIAATGNYAFFNLLTITLCITLLDDRHICKLIPASWREKVCINTAEVGTGRVQQAKKCVLAAFAVLLISLDIEHVLTAIPTGDHPMMIPPLLLAAETVAPFGISNGYGLFAVMTTERYEIVIEGSNDRVTWLPYEFHFKPGDLDRPPPIVAPHQPRLDWQMWFASLATYETQPWFGRFILRLLQGSPDVLRLLSKNPFPNSPPIYMRAQFYQYHFTNATTVLKTGAWWQREYRTDYFPAATKDGPAIDQF